MVLLVPLSTVGEVRAHAVLNAREILDIVSMQTSLGELDSEARGFVTRPRVPRAVTKRRLELRLLNPVRMRYMSKRSFFSSADRKAMEG